MERPVIFTAPGRLPWMIDEAEQAVVANYALWGLFQRGGIIVRAVTLTAEDAEREKKRIRRQPGAFVLRPATAPMIDDIFGRAVHWQDGKTLADRDCPAKVAQQYLSRAGLWRLPELLGIVEAPVMRPDGTIVTARGYDEPTALVLKSPLLWPSLPSPSRAAAQAAIKCLTEPFAEFPFSTPAGWSVLVSAILTGIQRRLLPTAPAHAIDAPAQESGKSLLADCVSIVVVGRPVSSMSANNGRNGDEELRKKLMAVLIAGDAIVSLDNITQPLRSDALATILTLETYQDRILGVSQTASAPTNILFLLTGNNLTLSGDMPSRVVIARIEPECERPGERTFQISDLRAHVLERRPQLVCAALTILQSYFFAGRPPQGLKPFGRFEQWSHEIREAIVWAGLPDPCLTRDDIVASDPERDNTFAVFENWFRVVGDGKVTLQRLIQCARDDEYLREALTEVAADTQTDHHGRISSHRLAAWCRAQAGRIVGEYKLVRAGEAHAGFKTWQIVHLDAQAQKTKEL
jgi:putative DNA primase/helicase